MLKTALLIYGLCFLIIDSTIFNRIREVLSNISFFEKLLSCYFCVGVWVSMSIWIAKYYPLPPLTLAIAFNFIEFIFCFAATAYAFNIILSVLEGIAALLAHKLRD